MVITYLLEESSDHIKHLKVVAQQICSTAVFLRPVPHNRNLKFEILDQTLNLETAVRSLNLLSDQMV